MTENKVLQKLVSFKKEFLNGKIVIPKERAAYGYDYAPLDTILPIIEPLLLKHGLFYSHNTGTDENSWKPYLETIIFELEGVGHITSKTVINTDVKLAKMNEFMVIGSALTYFRRYHLVTMLGLLTDEDTDAGAVSGGRSIEKQQEKVDFVQHFITLTQSGKTKKQLESIFAQYKKQFSNEEELEILNLIKGAKDENK